MSAPATSDTTPTSSADPSPGSSGTQDDASSSSSGDPPTSSTESGGGDLQWLQNDDWTSTDSIRWQQWPGIGDCWASTYEIDDGLYPFDIVELEVAIGGAGGTQTYEVGVWSVDGDGAPGDPIDTAMVEIEGDVGLEPHVDLAGVLDLSTVESGGFAIVMCHTEHMGSPSIATDTDGSVDGQHNWVFQVAMGEWVSAPDFFGIDGDFIMRAGVRPQE